MLVAHNSCFLHNRVSNDLKREISELLLQLQRVGGHETDPIVNQLKLIPDFVHDLDEALHISSQKPEGLTDEVMAPLRDLELACSDLLKSLYRQNHAFRFLQRLVGVLNDLQGYIVGQSNMEAEFSMISSNVIQRLKSAFAFLIDDFRSFSDKTLPKFVVEEEERATTRYLTLTTIATFFSSITATTLQFSFAGETNSLSGVVDLFWYISLVFSVSSGINSLLSMLWRKSAVYSEKRRPPTCFKLWLIYAPIYFLAISVFAFIIGLSLFVYSSDQPTYVATTTIGFTTLHVLGILIVMSWFLLRRNWSTLIVQYLRRNFSWILLLEDEVIEANRCIGGLRNWPASPSRPNPLAILLRHFMILLRACFRGVERYLLVPLQNVIKRLKGMGKKEIKTPRTAHGDPEVGEEDPNTDTSIPDSEVDQAVEDFKSALKDTFPGKNPIAVDDFEKRFMDWQRPSYHLQAFTIGNSMKSILWGYPKLLRQFQTEVLPAMVRHEDQVQSPSRSAQSARPADAGSSVRSLVATGDGSDNTARSPSPLSSVVEGKGSENERREEEPESHNAVEFNLD